jgi:CXXC-20-CXXC protein
LLNEERDLVKQKCHECSKEFSWMEIEKSPVLAYKPIECRGCGTKHYIKLSSRKIISLLIVVPFMLFVIYFAPIFSLSITPAILIGVFITLIISCLFPFIVKNEANDEGTWL